MTTVLVACTINIYQLKHRAISRVIAWHGTHAAAMNVRRGVCFACSYSGTIYGDTDALAICERCRNSVTMQLRTISIHEYPIQITHARVQARDIFAAMIVAGLATRTQTTPRIDTCDCCMVSYSNITTAYNDISICGACHDIIDTSAAQILQKLPLARNIINGYTDVSREIMRWYTLTLIEYTQI